MKHYEIWHTKSPWEKKFLSSVALNFVIAESELTTQMTKRREEKWSDRKSNLCGLFFIDVPYNTQRVPPEEYLAFHLTSNISPPMLTLTSLFRSSPTFIQPPQSIESEMTLAPRHNLNIISNSFRSYSIYSSYWRFCYVKLNSWKCHDLLRVKIIFLEKIKEWQIQLSAQDWWALGTSHHSLSFLMAFYFSFVHSYYSIHFHLSWR